MKKNWHSMVSQIQAYRNDPVPVEYILGGTFFCGEWFKVTPDVLIPRLETEVLVEYIVKKSEIETTGKVLGIQNMPLTLTLSPTGRGKGEGEIEYKSKVFQRSQTIRILDLGTGCGNIAIILAKRLECKVYAVDISGEALFIAKRNTKMHGVENRVEFYKTNWFVGLDIEPVDIIVSNPPYISEEDWESLPIDVRDYEPRIALWGGKGGLEHYKKIISGARKILVPGGKIVLEIGYNQAESVKDLLEGFKNIEIINDNFGIPRVMSAVF